MELIEAYIQSNSARLQLELEYANVQNAGETELGGIKRFTDVILTDR